MSPRRAATTSVVAVVAVVSLLLLVALWASSIGPDRVFHGHGLDRVTVSLQPSTTSPSTAPTSINDVNHALQRTPEDHPVLRAIAFGVEVLVGLLILLGLAVGIRRIVQGLAARARRTPPPTERDFDVLAEPEPARERVRDQAAEALAGLDEGLPRNAIVAAWDSFEASAAHLDLARKPWETSSEFVLRLLELVSADERAVSRLEHLYREARYSTHQLGEEHREAARTALEQIHASLRGGLHRRGVR